MQIRTKLSINFSAIVIAILAVSFLAIYISSSIYRKDDFINRLYEKAYTTADLFFTVEEVNSVLLKRIDQKKRDLLYMEKVMIFDDHQNRLYASTDSVLFNIKIQDFEAIAQSENFLDFQSGDFEFVGFKYIFNERTYFVFAGAIDRYGISKIKYLLNTLLISFVIFSGMIFFAGYFFAGKALKPISKIVSQVRGFSTTNFSVRLMVENNRDELARLTQTINSLLNRIESAFQLQKSFVANASHELKNPLAMITSQIEVTLLKEREPFEYQGVLNSVLQDVKEINEIVQRLMELATIESDSSGIVFNKVRPDEILYQARMDFLKRFPDSTVDTEVLALPEDDATLIEQGNERLLRIAFFNLIENGSKYSEDGKLLITFESKDFQNSISFINKSSKTKDLDLNKIFEPFHRGNESRTIRGHGIGLYLVKKIAEIHRAKIEVTNTDENLVKFTMVFPRKKWKSN